MRARSLAREGQLSARRPNGVRGNPPLPSNSGIVATDDPVRRREDEEGGEVNNPQIDGMNPDRTGGDRATVGGVGGTGGDTQNRGTGQATGVAEGSVVGGGGMEANAFNPDSKLNKVMEDLKGKSSAEIKKYFSNLSPSEINQLVKDGKNLPGPLKATETVITKSEKIAVKEREIDPSKEADVRKINDKVESFISQQLLKNYSDKLNAHNANYDSAFGKYEQTAANSETIRIMGESIQRLDADSPLRKQLEATREFFMTTSSSDGGINTFLGTVKPTADQLIAATKKMEDYNSRKITNLDAETSKLIAHQLILDKEFAAMAQPQSLKDSYVDLKAKQTAAEKGFAESIKKFENKEISQKELTAELKRLEAEYNKALNIHKDNWKKYEGDVAKMIQNRDADRKITLTNLDRVTANIVVDGPAKIKEVKANYKVYTDESGNYKLVASGEAALLERAAQRTEFKNAIALLPKDFKVQIDPDTGKIKTGLDGKELTMKPEDAVRRREAVDAIKESLGRDVFDPKKNPNFAKLEAMGNFDVDKNGRNFTTVDGVRFDFELKNDVPPERSIVEADGANWMKLSQAANDLKISSIGLNSVVRDDASSHKGGYSLDVGSITDKNGNTVSIKYNNVDFEKGVIPPTPKAPLDRFLDQIAGSDSNKFSYNPYYMVDGNGNRTPNFFTAVPESEWRNGKDWDSKDSGLTSEQRKEFSKLMREMASKNDPPYVLTDDNLKQMWNHRHHLHVTEVSK